MVRRVFTLLSAISLLLAIATAAIWLRGYFVGDALSINLPQFGRVPIPI
ncbi:MAG: hypothetical protein JWM97_1462 [Phycisphaerales bacterium]|nr:hypothetical protein [Phycisphaerales bacterium]